MTRIAIGTDAYDKWLVEFRQTTNIYEGAATYDECCEYYIYRRGRTPKQEEQALLKFKRAQTRKGNEDVKNMIVRHKKVYYEKMVMWTAFKDVSGLNQDVKQEIRKFI